MFFAAREVGHRRKVFIASGGGRRQNQETQESLDHADAGEIRGERESN